MTETPDIPGAANLVAWFGYWPTFQDAGVLSITLNRSGVSEVAIHAFDRTSQVDAKGYYILQKHAIVTFMLEGFPLDRSGITNIRIEAFNHQNVLSSLVVETSAEGHQLRLESCYGVDASLVCERLSVRFEPGIPKVSTSRSEQK